MQSEDPRAKRLYKDESLRVRWWRKCGGAYEVRTREARSLAASPRRPREERMVVVQRKGRAVLPFAPPPTPAARSRLIIGDFGPSDSALAASSGWRLRRPAADRHAARCASRDLCSGGAPRRYPPSP